MFKNRTNAGLAYVAAEGLLLAERDHLAEVLVRDGRVVHSRIVHAIVVLVLLSHCLVFEELRVSYHLTVTLDSIENGINGLLLAAIDRLETILLNVDRYFLNKQSDDSA